MAGWAPRILVAAILAVLAPGCSKSSAKADPCDLLRVSETQALDATIAKATWAPAKKGARDELCVYESASGEPRVMVFVWRRM